MPKVRGVRPAQDALGSAPSASLAVSRPLNKLRPALATRQMLATLMKIVDRRGNGSRMSDFPATAYIIKFGSSYLCPVCGYDGTFQGDHYDDEEGGRIATGICSCCLFEPGFDDNSAATADASDSIAGSISAYRQKWLERDSPWLGGQTVSPPSGWDAHAQLARLLRIAPFLER